MIKKGGTEENIQTGFVTGYAKASLAFLRCSCFIKEYFIL